MRFRVHLCERITNNRRGRESGCFANERVWITVVSCPVQMAWHTVGSVRSHMPPGHVLAQINREKRRRMKKQQWKSIAACRISAPSVRKMHFSSFLVHWFGPGGNPLWVWCRTFFRSSLLSMFSLGPAQKDAQMLCTNKTQMKNDAMILQVDIYSCVLVFSADLGLNLPSIVQMMSKIIHSNPQILVKSLSFA